MSDYRNNISEPEKKWFDSRTEDKSAFLLLKIKELILMNFIKRNWLLILEYLVIFFIICFAIIVSWR